MLVALLLQLWAALQPCSRSQPSCPDSDIVPALLQQAAGACDRPGGSRWRQAAWVEGGNVADKALHPPP